MCGILGVFDPRGVDPSSWTPRLEAADRAIAHRGPDASGRVLRPAAGLGHRRLSILDLNPRSNQPMASADGSLWMTYNGEIYNFAELRAELEKAGRSFRTTSDTEVLLEGYRQWGVEGLLGRCAGMWAFALYDEREGKLVLARDRAGKKPLYWAREGGATVFCSELRGLLALRARAPQPSPEGLDAYLALKFVPSPGTLIEGVSKLLPGCWAEVSASGATVRRFWSPLGRGVRPGSPEEAERLVEAALATAVRRRLVSDVPVCLFLSGGVDSSLIAAELASAGAKGTVAYTAAYPDMPGYDETRYAAVAAKAFGLDHRPVPIASGEVLAALSDPELVLDDPVSDWVWVPLHFLSRRARADGFKVVLLGEGSDELFFGYDVMEKGLRELRRWRGSAVWAARLAYGLGRPIWDVSRRGHRRFDTWRRAASGEPVYWGSSVGFPPSQRHQVAGPALGAETAAAQAFLARLYEEFSRDGDGDDANLISYVEFYGKMGETLLHRVDRISMLHSLEARAPFLDHELAELAFSLPGDWKRRGGRLKGLLKDVALKRLPRELVDRPKMGFSFPFKEWLRGPLGPEVERVFETGGLFRDHWVNRGFCRALLSEHRGGRVDHAPRLWQLYSLARWYDRWVR